MSFIRRNCPSQQRRLHGQVDYFRIGDHTVTDCFGRNLSEHWHYFGVTTHSIFLDALSLSALFRTHVIMMRHLCAYPQEHILAAMKSWPLSVREAWVRCIAPTTIVWSAMSPPKSLPWSMTTHGDSSRRRKRWPP